MRIRHEIIEISVNIQLVSTGLGRREGGMDTGDIGLLSKLINKRDNKQRELS